MSNLSPNHLTTQSGDYLGSVSRHVFEMECSDPDRTEHTSRNAPHLFGGSNSSSNSAIAILNDVEDVNGGNELDALVVVVVDGGSSSFETYKGLPATADTGDDARSLSAPSSVLTRHLSHHLRRSFRAQVIAGLVGIFFILIVASQMGRYPLDEDNSGAASLPDESAEESSCPLSDGKDIDALLAKVQAQSPRDRCHDPDDDDNNDDDGDIKSQGIQQPCHCSNPLEPANFTDRPEWNRGYLRNVELAREAVASSRSLDVVLLGDSIIEFWQATYKGAPIAMFEGNRVVYQRLFDSRDAPIQGLALGVAGDKCNQLLYRIQNGIIEGLHPAVFWVLIGTNDVLSSSCRADQVLAGNVAIVRELQRQRPNATIVVQALLPVGDAAGIVLPNLYATINRRLACVARASNANGAASAGAPVHFVNVTELFLTSNNTVNETLLPDRLHPSAMGAEVWGNAIVSTVLRILQQ
jgi:lysophospholipase L1-like esterase